MPSSQAPVRTSLLLAGGTILALSQWIAQSLPMEQRAGAVWPILLGTLLFLVPVITVLRNAQGATQLERILTDTGHWFHLADWQIVLLLASPFLSYLAFVAAGDSSLMQSPAAAVAAWSAALCAAVIGGLTPRVHLPRLQPLAAIPPVAITLLAFVIRAVDIGRIPIILTGDEGAAGVAALDIIKGRLNNPFISGWFSFPTLYFFLQSLSIRAFGETTAALRLPSALAGALTVTAVYFTARILFDSRTALLSAIFLAAYSFHVNFSRIGLNNIWDGLWYTIVIGTLWYAWVHEQTKAFTIAGLCLGIAQYFYPSGRILILPIALWFLIMAFIDRARFRRILPGLLLMLLISMVVLLPLGLFYILHPDEFMAPFNRVTLFGSILASMIQNSHQPVWLILLIQIARGLGGFTYLPLNAWYTPGTPLLLPLPASLFLVGLAILLVRDRRERFPLLALWIFTFGLIGGLSESTPAAQRYIAAAPVCALLVGYGLSETGGLLERLWPKLAPLLYGVTLAVAFLTAANELNFYFRVYTPRTVSDWSHSSGEVAQRLADRLQGQPSDLEVVFFGQPLMGFQSIASLQYLAPAIRGIDATIPWTPLSTPAIQGRKRLMFVFLPGNESAIQPVEAAYPGGELARETASDGKTLYWHYDYLGR